MDIEEFSTKNILDDHTESIKNLLGKDSIEECWEEYDKQNNEKMGYLLKGIQDIYRHRDNNKFQG